VARPGSAGEQLSRSAVVRRSRYDAAAAGASAGVFTRVERVAASMSAVA
jgi:hypothetical protein